MSYLNEILKRYWGYEQFRPLQEEIIQSVMDGRDTLALLPTGGGKSICFQVPALALDGLCLVITPLIALMKDQVEQLKKRGIGAVAIHSGMNAREIDHLLDNCIYGSVKFLYISPERLTTDLFKERVKKMKISLLAVDEAHCISQWGYDFRPAYLGIAEFRKTIPEVKIIALTATATRNVRNDITEKLLFQNGQVYQKSFARDNLSYMVKWQEDKDGKLLEALRNVGGSSIVYVRNRKRAKEIAQFLLRNRIAADYYHAGLGNPERSAKQDAWIGNRIRTIVATNAFGMGIDKPDVRLVVHMDLPENLESYYQEAGRAGRDGKKSFAAILANENDIRELKERVTRSFPPVEYLKRVYQSLANYYKIAVGSSLMASYDFDLRDFSKTFALDAFETYNAIKKLEQEGFLLLNESFFNPSRLYAPGGKRVLYEFQIAHAEFDALIKILLRLYGGEIFTGFVKISESQIAQLLHVSTSEATAKLDYLGKNDVIVYDHQKDKPQIAFLTPRYDANKLPLDIRGYNQRRELELAKMETVGNYVLNNRRCRTLQLLEYFDEISDNPCGICDVCVKRNRENHPDETFFSLREKILALTEARVHIDSLIQSFKPADKETILTVLKQMIDNGEIRVTGSNEIEKKS